MLQLGQIDRADDRPAYRQIADILRAEIASNRLGPSQRLPSEAELIEHFGVARMTVRQAIQELRTENLVFAEHGRGVFVRPSSRYVEEGAEVQVGMILFPGRSHTEIARLIAHDHGWRLRGDEVIEENGRVVAPTLEELGRRALKMDWFDKSGAFINWSRFGGAKDTNAETIRKFLG